MASILGASIVWPISQSAAVETGSADLFDGPLDYSEAQLGIELGQGGAKLSWPLRFDNWILEQAHDPSASVGWLAVAVQNLQSSSSNITVALPPMTGPSFYRLRNPATSIPDLSGQWTFDGVGSSLGLKSSNVVLSVGRIGSGALSFNGSSAGPEASVTWISNSNYSVLPAGSAPFSVSFWFMPDVLQEGWSGLMGNDRTASNGWHLALHCLGPGTNELVFAATGPGASLRVAGRKLLLPFRWYELTATYDGREGVMYVDGELLARSEGSLFGNADPIRLGGGVQDYRSFSGRIDELRTWTNALTAEAVSLAGQWQFEENGGGIAADTSIRGHHAALSNPAGWIDGRTGSGIDLSSTVVVIRNDYADVIPATGGSFSLSFWLRPRSLATAACGLMSCAEGTNSGWSLSLHEPIGGRPLLNLSSTNSGGTLSLAAPVELVEGTWTKVDITFNGGIGTLYMNGRKVASASGSIRGNRQSLRIGTVAGLPGFNGTIDELKIYRRERGEADIGPVAKVMWETVLINSRTNFVLQGFGPPGKALTYTILGSPSPTKGTLQHSPGSSVVTYTAGSTKGPDTFAYTVSDGEFTSPPTLVALSVVQPHWLAPSGGPTPPLDGSSPERAWAAGAAAALDAIWKTNAYYDCFFYAPGEYHTSGCNYNGRPTALPGCKHIGSGSEGPGRTTVRLVNAWGSWTEETIFGAGGQFSPDFEVRDMVLDCNAVNNPKITNGEPVWITLPLTATSRVDTLTLRWHDAPYMNGWRFGPPQDFTVYTRLYGANGYITNRQTLRSTGRVDVVRIDAEADLIMVQMERRASGVDFYSLSEIELTGAAISLPRATTPEGAPSRLGGGHGIVKAVDGNEKTDWASGPEEQARIELPLNGAVPLNQIDLQWNCETLDGIGRLGAAAFYQIEARDPATGQFYDVPFVPQARAPGGAQVNVFTQTIITDCLVLLLNVREPGVDFYSLTEVQLRSGGYMMPLKLPSALNSLSWGNYQVLRALDEDPATAWASDTQGMVGAIVVSGSNLKFTNLKVIGFGTTPTRECFPMYIYGPAPSYDPNFQVGNILVENCVVTEPAPMNRDGLTSIAVGGMPPHLLTNVLVRRCTVANVKPHFRYSSAFSSINVEQCLATNVHTAVYFEPNRVWGDNVGPVLIRSNTFFNVDNGVYLTMIGEAKFDTLSCFDNEIVLTGSGQWGLAACDTCVPGANATVTNLTALNNVVRFADWSTRAGSFTGGLHCGNIHNAVLGNNVVTLGNANALRLRSCPSGSVVPNPIPKVCDGEIPVIPPSVLPPCLDALPAGYRRAWFNNRDLSNTLLNVRYATNYVDGFASQQQFP